MDSYLLKALKTSYNQAEDQNLVQLALSSEIRDTIRVFYDQLSNEHPRKLVTRNQVAKVLEILNLPPTVTPNYCTVADFERILTGQFCEKQKITFREPNKLTMKEIFEKIRLRSHQQVAPESLKVIDTLDRLRNLHRAIAPVQSGGILGNLTVENLVRTVLKQQAEIDALKEFAQDLCTEMKSADLRNLAANAMREKEKPILNQEQKIDAVNDSLKVLKKTLVTLKPLLQSIESQTNMTQSCYSDFGKAGEKSFTDDSGWISDCGEVCSTPSDPSMDRSSAAVLEQVPDLPLDEKSPTAKSPTKIWAQITPISTSPLRPKTLVPLKGSAFIRPQQLNTRPSAFALRTRLVALSSRLAQAENKLGKAIESNAKKINVETLV